MFHVFLLFSIPSRDTLDRQLNGDEAVAFGAALYAATLSTQFRVSEIKVRGGGGESFRLAGFLSNSNTHLASSTVKGVCSDRCQRHS